MFGPRRRKPVSPLQRFEFLVFLVPVSFFLLAFLVLAMTLTDSPTARHLSVGSKAARSRTSLRSSALPSLEPSVLCGHPMHGVASAVWSLYCVGAGDWLCVQSRELLDSANVNDDYCDCADGSDEPGTSACAGRESSGVRFTCAAQQNHSLPLSTVNDGVCDCCDGSAHQHDTQRTAAHSHSLAHCTRRCVRVDSLCGAALIGYTGAMSGSPFTVSTTARHPRRPRCSPPIPLHAPLADRCRTDCSSAHRWPDVPVSAHACPCTSHAALQYGRQGARQSETQQDRCAARERRLPV